MRHLAHDNGQRPLAPVRIPAENDARVAFGGVTSAKECARIAALGLALLADSHAWMAAQSPQFRDVPVEAMAFACAAVSPWRTPAELAPCVRMYLWIYAFDDYVERSDLAQLDDMLRRCAHVIGGHGTDNSHWLLTALSSWQQDLTCRPLYPALADLWIDKFGSMLESMRHQWMAGRSAGRDGAAVDDYLAHADSVAAWVMHLPRWITYGDSALLDHLDVLVSAFSDYVIAVRLANDLASFARERDHHGDDNVLMYGVSHEWVNSEIARRAGAAAHRLADLVAAEVVPAVELIREVEYATTFYSLADFRGWGSDAGGPVYGDGRDRRRH
jgi:hypothetical protein